MGVCLNKFILILIVFSVVCVSVQAGDAAMLPVKRVILSTSGIAHFEHEGTVTDDARISLSVQFDQVDDLLKSLMVFDSSGQLGSVSLPGRAPLSQIFRDLPFSRHEINSPVALLNALQGADVTVTGPAQISGKLIRLVPETVALDDGRQVMTRHRLTLSSENGLKQTILEDLNALRFEDAKLRLQIDQALTAIHQNAARDSRVLTIDLQGDGIRNVAMAYVVEAPLWKAAYRLLLPARDKQTSFMQGWAIIENMTGQDWDDVALTLVSGNPVTFRQSLYQSYYARRPLMPVEVLGRVFPRSDTGSLGKASSMAADHEVAELEADQFSGRRKASAMGKTERVSNLDQTEEIVAGEMPASVASAPLDGSQQFPQALAAVSEEATTQVLFRFPGTFNLPAGHSMMLPFVSRELPIERVWLYQSETHAVHPLAALRIKNDGKTGLPPGILTLFDENSSNGTGYFAGDAKLPGLPKGEERLVSFALDTRTLIDKEDKSTIHQDTVTISGGVLTAITEQRSKSRYTVKAPAEEARMVIVEHPRQHQYELVQPDPDDVEITNTHYRIRMSVQPGERKIMNVVLKRDRKQSLQIMDLSYQQLHAYTTTTYQLDQPTRGLFEEMARMRLTVDKIDTELRQLDDNRESIFNDQQRLRENLRAVPNNSDIGRRYLERLSNQEDKIEEIATRRAKLEVRKNAQLEKLKGFIADINI